MALRLYAPGTRKGNKYWVARGSVAGSVREFSTNTTDEKIARRIAREAEVRFKPQRAITFAEAARRYVEFRGPTPDERRRLSRIVSLLGSRRIREITAGDLHNVALHLYGDTARASTKNRHGLRPAITVLHHAARSGFCDWIRVERFREAPPKARALDPGTARLLIAAATHLPLRMLLVWLFHQGTRIGATLRITWDHIDLERQTVEVWNGKGNRYETFPLHDTTAHELSRIAQSDRCGNLFPWTNPCSVFPWWVKLRAETGIYFTPHMARHTLGTMMARNGESLRAIMGALGHSSASSSMRYQNGDIEMVRAATAKVRLVG